MTTRKKFTFPIDEIVSRWGACSRDIDLMRDQMGDTATFSADHLDKFEGVDVIWGLRMLKREVQEQLVFSWYDRALGASDAGWKNEIRGLLAEPDERRSRSHVLARRAEAKAAASESEKYEAAVGYAMAQIAMTYAQGHSSDTAVVLSALRALAKHASKQCALVEGKDVQEVMDEFRREVLGSIGRHGVIPE